MAIGFMVMQDSQRCTYCGQVATNHMELSGVDFFVSEIVIEHLLTL